MLLTFFMLMVSVTMIILTLYAILSPSEKTYPFKRPGILYILCAMWQIVCACVAYLPSRSANEGLLIGNFTTFEFSVACTGLIIGVYILNVAYCDYELYK